VGHTGDREFGVSGPCSGRVQRGSRATWQQRVMWAGGPCCRQSVAGVSGPRSGRVQRGSWARRQQRVEREVGHAVDRVWRGSAGHMVAENGGDWWAMQVTEWWDGQSVERKVG
jgi:hypothetical protein